MSTLQWSNARELGVQLHTAATNALQRAGTLVNDDNGASAVASLLWLPDVLAAQAALLGVAGKKNENNNNSNAAAVAKLYQTSLALQPTHVASLIGSAMHNRRLGVSRLIHAHAQLTAALQVDATQHVAWYELGMVLQAQGDALGSADRLLTALELELSCPIDDSVLLL
jgi:hypothetical protein